MKEQSELERFELYYEKLDSKGQSNRNIHNFHGSILWGIVKRTFAKLHRNVRGEKVKVYLNKEGDLTMKAEEVKRTTKKDKRTKTGYKTTEEKIKNEYLGHFRIKR